MRLLVFSDLHGNSYALDAFLERIQNEEYDRKIFCGDIFGYYYNQHEIIKKLAQMDDLIWLKGNHDDYFLRLFCGMEEEEDYVEHYGHSYRDVRRRFTRRECDRIAACRSEYVIAGEDCQIGIFHGTRQNPLVLLFSDIHIAEWNGLWGIPWWLIPVRSDSLGMEMVLAMP